jgi:hypothetical protein
MNAQPASARLCGCEHPLLDTETCLRCGRPRMIVAEPLQSLPPARRKVTWTRPGVARAIRAFAFFRGRPPVAADWNQRMANWPSFETVETLFGSLEAAISAATPVKEEGDVH